MRTALSLLLGLVVWGASGAGFAQSSDAVAVLSVGGVDSVNVFDVVRDPEPRAIRLGSRRVLPVTVGPARITDIKILPDGSALLADVNGRGAAISSPDGTELTFELDPLMRYLDVDAVSVASYFAPGTPSLLLVGDSAASAVTIRGASSGDVVWFRSLRLATSPAEIVQTIVMPDNRIAIALEYTFLGVSGVEVVSTDGLEPLATFVSEEHAERPANAIIIPELDIVRDLMGLENGNLLVTTRHDVLELTLDGTIARRFSVGDYPELNGELASSRQLPSGDLAVATFEPGEWVRPHNNHRVHWLHRETGALVATSEPLTRAPLRVEPLAGTGGTGTFGFDGGLDEIQQGNPEEVSLVDLRAVPEAAEVGGTLTVQATVANDGAFPVGLATLVIRGSAGDCGSELQDDFDFARRDSVAIAAGQTYFLLEDVPIDAQFGLGAWCLYVEGQDREGVWRQYGEALQIEIVEATGGPDSEIVVTPLPFGPDIDAGIDADVGPDVGMEDEWVPKKGCCSTTSSKSSTGAWMFLLVALIAAARRR